jgi:nucleoside-diphosphate-sugar epimerase
MILVTGANGFIGSRLCEELLLKGYTLMACMGPSGQIPARLKPYSDKIQWIQVNLSDYAVMLECISKVNAVFHCAAKISFDAADKNEMWKSNVQVTKNLVDVCLELGHVYFMHLSSIAAVGDAKAGKQIDESCPWVFNKFSSNYSITKYEAEREVWRGIHEGLQACIVNPSVVLGYNERNEGAMSFLHQVKKGLNYFPTGSTGFVDVQDVVLSMVALYEKKIVAERFILNAENRTFQSVLADFAEALGRPAPSKEISKRTLTFISILWGTYLRLMGRKSTLSKDSIRAAYRKMEFNNSKIKGVLNVQFMSIRESVIRMVKENQ